MITRQRIVSYGIPTVAVGTIVAAALLSPWNGGGAVVEEPSRPTPTTEDSAARQIDVVFAVDTTASMGGLIEGAKRTVWSIANHIKQSDQHADVHVGLVAYRDIGDDYVTRDFPLSGDLDAMFVELSSYRAAGGGDIPEDVAAGMYDSIYKMKWRANATKMIFIVGDAAPADRGDVPRFDVLAKTASDKQIIVNTIRCGEDRDTAAAWQQIAMLGHGEFSTIRQDGGVQDIATPYDDKLAALSSQIDHSSVILGAAHRGHYAAKMAAAEAAPAAAKADRAGYYASMGSAAARDDGDAVAKVAKGGTATVDTMNADDLPADLQGLSKDELKKELSSRADKRKELQNEIEELSKKRAEFLKTKAGKDGFDGKVKDTVDRELKR